MNASKFFSASSSMPKTLPGKTDEFIRETIDQDREIMDPEVFESYDTFNFSQIWFTFSVAYLF